MRFAVSGYSDKACTRVNCAEFNLLFVKIYGIMKMHSDVDMTGCTTTWGCRVSTGEQVEELQVEVSVRTLVKQPTNNRCQTGIRLRSRCLITSDASSPRLFPVGSGRGVENAGCYDEDRLLIAI